jgi:peptidoglycan/xylan/chitin deacetylase (PgdA/CDA1 family)
MTGPIPILLYHVANVPPGARRGLAVAASELRTHTGALQAPGRSAVAIGAIAAHLRGVGQLPPRRFAVTLDDATIPTYDAAVELALRAIPVSLYVSTGSIGHKGMLTAPRLVELSRLPAVQLGAHAVRHRRLDELATTEIREEVAGSKAALEDIIQRPVTSFAYPHGAYDARVRQAVRAAGYESAVAVKNALSHAADDPFAMARWTVPHGTPVARVAEVLDGIGVPMAWREERARTRAFRTVRRLYQRSRRDPAEAGHDTGRLTTS